MGVFEDSVATFLAPIQEFLADPTVSEVLVNGPHRIFVERRGVLEPVPARFNDEQALQAAVRNIAQSVGRRVDAQHPALDARLPDGSRVAAVLPPSSRHGTTLSIRKFSGIVPTFLELIKRGMLSEDGARFLDVCVFLAKNLVVSGGTGSGKTTFLNVLGSRIPQKERILVVEDSSELQIRAPHAVYFESVAADAQGKGEFAIRDVLKSVLRLRPDRIVVGEVRGAEALDLVTAMSTGHGGSMGTVHANAAVEGLARLETLSLMSGTQLPAVALRRQIASAVQIVVQTKRFGDGSRRVTQISEVLPDLDERDRFQVADIFRFVLRGRDATGKVVGEMLPTGYIPSFASEIELNRLPFPIEKFRQVA